MMTVEMKITDDGRCQTFCPKTGDSKNPGAGPLPGQTGFLEGGLWLPKQPGNGEPKLFFLFDPTWSPEQAAAAQNAAGQPTNAAQGVGACVGGAIVGAVVESGRGDVLWVPYGSERPFVSSLEITGY